MIEQSRATIEYLGRCMKPHTAIHGRLRDPNSVQSTLLCRWLARSFACLLTRSLLLLTTTTTMAPMSLLQQHHLNPPCFARSARLSQRPRAQLGLESERSCGPVLIFVFNSCTSRVKYSRERYILQILFFTQAAATESDADMLYYNNIHVVAQQHSDHDNN